MASGQRPIERPVRRASSAPITPVAPQAAICQGVHGPWPKKKFEASAATLNGIYASLARGVARVGCVDGHGPLANTAGGYADVLPANGRLERVRRFDGVHLTVAGARRLAHAMAAGAVRAARGGFEGCPA